MGFDWGYSACFSWRGSNRWGDCCWFWLELAWINSRWLGFAPVSLAGQIRLALGRLLTNMKFVG